MALGGPLHQKYEYTLDGGIIFSSVARGTEKSSKFVLCEMVVRPFSTDLLPSLLRGTFGVLA